MAHSPIGFGEILDCMGTTKNKANRKDKKNGLRNAGNDFQENAAESYDYCKSNWNYDTGSFNITLFYSTALDPLVSSTSDLRSVFGVYLNACQSSTHSFTSLL